MNYSRRDQIAIMAQFLIAIDSFAWLAIKMPRHVELMAIGIGTMSIIVAMLADIVIEVASTEYDFAEPRTDERGVIAETQVDESSKRAAAAVQAPDEDGNEPVGVIASLTVTPDGTRVVGSSNIFVGGASGAYVWDLKSGMRLRTLTREPAQFVVAADEVAAFTIDTGVSIVGLNTGELLKTLPTGGDDSRFVVTPDGKRIVTASPIDGLLQIWDVQSGNVLHKITAESPISLTLIAGRFASRSMGGTLNVWDLSSGEQLFDTFRIPNATITDMAFIRGGQGIVVVARRENPPEFSLHIGNVQTGLSKELFPCTESYAIRVSPDEKTILLEAGDDNAHAGVFVYRLEDQGKAIVLHKEGVTGMAVTPDWKQVLSVEASGTLVVWDLDQILSSGIATFPTVRRKAD